MSSESPVSVHFVIEGVLDFERAAVSISEVDLLDVVGGFFTGDEVAAGHTDLRTMERYLRTKESLDDNAMDYAKL